MRATGPIDELRDRLTEWFRAQLPAAEEVRIEALDRVEFGHSAEMMVLALAWKGDGEGHRRDVVLRLRPAAPGLLEPYDLPRQFRILRALEGSAVRAPRALWLEDSGAVLGRPFYVMERLDGQVYERQVPAELDAAPSRIRRMSESMVEQIAAIHRIDLRATGLDALGDGRDYVDRELERWAGEMHRVQRGPLPALERLLAALRDRRPEACAKITLVHGDPKPGNFAFVGDEVSGVFDWELSTIGDPLADVGWAEVTWMTPTFTSRPGSLTVDEFVARYQELTGIVVRHREWYRAFQAFKMAVIMFVGAMLFDAGASDDLRLAEMGAAVPLVTRLALHELNLTQDLAPGPVTARKERVKEVRARAQSAR
jgi:aminoglycoside phosphotransferase (APT) family kinase protein